MAVQGKAGSTGDRPGHGLAAILARRMSGDGVLTELLLDAGAGVDERCRKRRRVLGLQPPMAVQHYRLRPAAAPRASDTDTKWSVRILPTYTVYQ